MSGCAYIDTSKVDQDCLSSRQVQTLAQYDTLRHHATRRQSAGGFETLTRPCYIRRVVRMVDEEPPGRRAPGLRPTRERQVDVDARAGARATHEPRVQVDEDRPDKLATFESSVSGHVGVIHRKLDDARRAGGPNEGVDDESGIVCWLHMGRLWRIERGPVNDGAVERYGLDLSHIIEAAFSRKIA